MTVKVKNKKKSEKEKPVAILGRPLIDVCPCGTKVAPWDRQDVVYNEEKSVFHRVCKDCIKDGCHFDSKTFGSDAA